MNSKKDVVSIMGLPFINTTKRQFMNNIITPDLLNNQKRFIVTANPEIAMRSKEDKDYQTAVKTADYILPDGIGIILASKILKQPLQERITGFDVTLDMIQVAEKHQLKCFFLGAKEEINKEAVASVQRKYPYLKIAGRHHGYFDLEDKSVVEKIYDSEADIIFVALGAPRQEMWISSHIDTFKKGIFIGIGGSLDVLSGVTKRAPDMWIKLNLEWLYRFLKQPTRFKRILKLFPFAVNILLKDRK